MTKVRTLLFAALAVVLACGICGQQALAQEDLSGEGYGTLISIGRIPDAPAGAIPDVSPGMYQGIVGMGPNPPASGDWPCFGGNTACTSIAAGGLVVAEPLQVVLKACSGCGQIYYTFETTTASGTGTFTFTVTQGSPAKTLFHKSFTGTVAKNNIYAIAWTGVTFTGGVAGAATISVSTKIGTATIKGAARIVLQ